MLGHERMRRMAQPIGKGYTGIIGTPEHLKVDKVRISGILDVVAKSFLNVSNVTWIKVLGHRVWAGIEYRHFALTSDEVRPFIGVRMPMHLAHSAWMDNNVRCRDCLRCQEIAAIGGPHLAALRHPRWGYLVELKRGAHFRKSGICRRLLLVGS